MKEQKNYYLDLNKMSTDITNKSLNTDLFLTIKNYYNSFLQLNESKQKESIKNTLLSTNYFFELKDVKETKNYYLDLNKMSVDLDNNALNMDLFSCIKDYYNYAFLEDKKIDAEKESIKGTLLSTDYLSEIE